MSYLQNHGQGVLETMEFRMNDLEAQRAEIESLKWRLNSIEQRMLNLDQTFIKGHLDYLEKLLS